jgi:hypothetical protein
MSVLKERTPESSETPVNCRLWEIFLQKDRFRFLISDCQPLVSLEGRAPTLEALGRGFEYDQGENLTWTSDKVRSRNGCFSPILSSFSLRIRSDSSLDTSSLHFGTTLRRYSSRRHFVVTFWDDTSSLHFGTTLHRYISGRHFVVTVRSIKALE